jgi:hypothetical protein
MTSRSRSATLAAALASSLWIAPACRAAIPDPPHDDFFFLAEHLPEAAEEARYFSLPWPDTTVEPGGWHPIVGIGGADVGADFARARGGLATLGVSHAWSSAWALEIFGYYGRFEVSGDNGENVLSQFALRDVPLDLPERARFSDPRGTVTHSGLGFAGARTTAGSRPWTFLGGLLLERLELRRYRFDYELLGGADAGATGVLDLSASNEFVTPYVGVSVALPLGKRWLTLPRAQLGVPLPSGDFANRMTGPDFDLSTDSTGAQPGKIGDGFFTLGAGLRDRVTGLEIDLGATLAFPLIQAWTHPGIDRAWLLSVTWYGR